MSLACDHAPVALRPPSPSAGVAPLSLTPAKMWKALCRLVEDPKVAKHVWCTADDLNRLAVFEIADLSGPERQELDPEDPIPPFPFPRLAVCSQSGVYVLVEPVLSGARLTFQAALFELYTFDHAVLAGARVEVDLAAPLDSTGRPDITTSDFTGCVTHVGRPLTTWPDDVGSVAARAEASAADAALLAEFAPRAVLEPGFREPVEHLRETRARYEEVRERVAQGRQTLSDLIIEGVRTGFHRALQCITWINRPKIFTVEVAAQIQRSKAPPPSHVLRLPERPTYTLIHHDEIVLRYATAHGGTHAPPIPHLRRGHARRLTADRYAKSGRRNTTIWVRPTSVGSPVTWTELGRVYRVRS